LVIFPIEEGIGPEIEFLVRELDVNF